MNITCTFFLFSILYYGKSYDLNHRDVNIVHSEHNDLRDVLIVLKIC